MQCGEYVSILLYLVNFVLWTDSAIQPFLWPVRLLFSFSRTISITWCVSNSRKLCACFSLLSVPIMWLTANQICYRLHLRIGSTLIASCFVVSVCALCHQHVQLHLFGLFCYSQNQSLDKINYIIARPGKRNSKAVHTSVQSLSILFLIVNHIAQDVYCWTKHFFWTTRFPRATYSHRLAVVLLKQWRAG